MAFFSLEKLCRVRNFILFLFLAVAFTFAFVSYYCENDTDNWACPLIGMTGHSKQGSLYPHNPTNAHPILSNIKTQNFPSRALNSASSHDIEKEFNVPKTFKAENFNQNGDDVFVFLHIQKTGGTTFGRHLVRNMQMDPPCTCYKGRKKCKCISRDRHIWLFSRFSTGWSCGLHADWTELKECVSHRLDKIEGEERPRRYLYITILREPIKRYLSEWRHVSRGATWKNAQLKCNGRRATSSEVPRCFQGDDWTGVTVQDFMKCPHNLANNRQTRMTANLSLIGCYNKSLMSEEQRRITMLRSAMDNLSKMSFVGFTEHQLFTQYLFERTFGVKFTEDFIQVNASYTDGITLSPAQRITVNDLNDLDVQLYQFAKNLFLQQVRLALLNDSRALQQLRTAGLLKPELAEIDTLLKMADFAELTSGRAPDPNTYWDPNLDVTS